MNVENAFFGLLLSLFAGLSTTLGAVIVFFIKKNDIKLISLSMGFSAGVMIGVSIFELLPQAIDELGVFIAGSCFLIGMLIVGIIDFIVPHEYEREIMYKAKSCDEREIKNPIIIEDKKLMRTGLLVAIGIAIHNFPEGFATITGTMDSINLGIILAVAIALHNIPEGLSVAIPIYCSSDSKIKAFQTSFLSGLAEPIGAIIGLIILISLNLITDDIIQLSLAIVAGIMIFISLDELLPTAYETGNINGHKIGHIVTIGIILGLAIMILTLVLLGE